MNRKRCLVIIILILCSSCAGKNISHELFAAASKGDAVRAADCLSKGADSSVTDPADKGDNPDYGPATALEAAIAANSFACAKLLYDRGARLEKGSEALHNLVQSEDPDPELVRLVAEQKDQVNAVDLGGDNPVGLAVRSGAADLVHILLEKGAAYTDAFGKDLGKKKAMADVEKVAKENPRAFTGFYSEGHLGFEGDGYYISFKDGKGRGKTFRAEKNPEMAYFIISEQTGMPAANPDIKGRKFKVWYWRGVETDVRGEIVPVSRYIHSEALEE